MKVIVHYCHGRCSFAHLYLDGRRFSKDFDFESARVGTAMCGRVDSPNSHFYLFISTTYFWENCALWVWHLSLILLVALCPKLCQSAGPQGSRYSTPLKPPMLF